MAGIPVVIAANGRGIPVRQVTSGASVMTIAASGYGMPIVFSDRGAPFIVQGGTPTPTPTAPFVATGPAYNGTAGSGYSGSPPTVVTGKATLKRLNPDGGFIGADDPTGMIVGVHGWASKADGSGGAASVTVNCYFEGNVYANVPLTFQTWTSAYDGVTVVGAWGYWVKLDPTVYTANGPANMYWEIIPTDAPAEKTVIGPHWYGRQAVLRPVVTYVTPSRVIADAFPNYKTLTAALGYMRTNSVVNGEIVLTETSSAYDVAVNAPGTPVENFPYDGLDKGRMVVHPAPGITATIAHASFATGGAIRPKRTGLTFRGCRIDMANFGSIATESVATQHAIWFDGCEIFSSTGRYNINALNYIEGFGQQCFFTECNIHDLLWGPVSSQGIQLIRNCKVHIIAGDYTQSAPNIYGMDCYDHSTGPYRVYRDAMTVQYSGAGAGTLAKYGSNGSTYNVTGPVGALRVVLNGVTTDIQLGVSKTCATVMSELQALGVTVTAGTEIAMWPSNYLQIGNVVGAQTTPIDIKTAPVQLTTFCDIHGDIVQAPPDGAIMCNIRAWNCLEPQAFFMADRAAAVPFANIFVINYAVANGVGSGGNAQICNIHTNVNIWHQSILDQPFQLRVTPPSGKTGYNPDTRCSIAGSLYPLAQFVGTADTDLKMLDNHYMTSGPAQSTNTTTGGARADFYVDPDNGDFTIKAASPLLSNYVTAQVPFDVYNNPRPAMGPRGASVKI